jgi:hypothetical protein
MTLEPPSDLLFFLKFIGAQSFLMRHNFSHSNQAAGTHQTPHGLTPKFGHHLFIQVYILLVALRTMTNAPASAAPGAPFASCALVPVSVGRTTMHGYPCVNSSMQPHERAQAYHITLTALSSQNIDLRLQLDALGHQLNLQAMVDGVINDWPNFFHNHWHDFSRLTILSFHSIKGNMNEDITTAQDSNILLPVQDGNVANCRRKNIKFVWVQFSIDFVLLINVPNQVGPTTLQTKHYLELPQTTRAMTNGNNDAYNLMTFHGAPNLHTLSPANVKAQILDATLQDSPVELQPASFGLRNSRTNGTALRMEIKSKILWLAFSTVCHTLFLELCPGSTATSRTWPWTTFIRST